jgi:hypothetical protein
MLWEGKFRFLEDRIEALKTELAEKGVKLEETINQL